MEDRFFLLNIKHGYQWAKGKSAAEYWLDDRMQAPIFYGAISIEEIRQGGYAMNRRGEQPRLFVDLLDSSRSEGFRPVIITIDSGKVWIYSLVSGPFERELLDLPEKGWKDLPKSFDIDVIKVVDVTNAPLVLSSMRANRWLSSGTFVPLSGPQYIGNVEAARHVAGLDGRGTSRLDCLSSVELETLVAKLFEENGYFVPAYRGGFVDGFDLVVKPSSCPKTALFKLTDEPMPMAIQVKLRVSDEKRVLSWLTRSENRLLVTSQEAIPRRLLGVSPQVLDRSWLLEALRVSPRTRDWLAESTSWVRFPLDG